MSLLIYIKEQGFNQVKDVQSNIRTLYIHEDGREVVYGLSEYKKPPTLIYPRPRILKIVNGIVYDQMRDDVMNHCMQKETPEDVLKAMFDKSILFEY